MNLYQVSIYTNGLEPVYSLTIEATDRDAAIETMDVVLDYFRPIIGYIDPEDVMYHVMPIED